VKNKHIGSSFDDFLREEGILEEVERGARKQQLAIDLRKVMRAKRVSEAEVARRMKTSRSAVRRILDPTEHGTRLDSLVRLAGALGCALDIRVTAGSKTRNKASPRAGAKRAA
jgi:antitoxin HicB